MIKRRWRTGLLPGLRRPRLPGRQLVPQLERQLPMALRDMRRGPTRRSPLHASALIKHKAMKNPQTFDQNLFRLLTHARSSA